MAGPNPIIYAQVGDFNLSRTAGSALTNSNLSANNPRWLAPEVITHQVQADSCVFTYSAHRCFRGVHDTCMLMDLFLTRNFTPWPAGLWFCIGRVCLWDCVVGGK